MTSACAFASEKRESLMREEIWEALESCTAPRNEHRVAPSAGEIALRKKGLLAFLEEIDGDASVADVRDALEDYRSDWR